MNYKRTLLCVKSAEDIVEVLLYSGKYNMICCLAVDLAYRKGELHLENYKKFWFEEGELIEEFGYPNQIFVLHVDNGADNVQIAEEREE